MMSCLMWLLLVSWRSRISDVLSPAKMRNIVILMTAAKSWCGVYTLLPFKPLAIQVLERPVHSRLRERFLQSYTLSQMCHIHVELWCLKVHMPCMSKGLPVLHKQVWWQCWVLYQCLSVPICPWFCPCCSELFVLAEIHNHAVVVIHMLRSLTAAAHIEKQVVQASKISY
jgi:hypothetical protein